jgi:hypothetical protein
VLETSSLKKRAVGEQQCKTRLRRNEGCMLCRLEFCYQGQHDFGVSFMKVVMDVTGTSKRRRNVSMPVSYSGKAALRRKQCNMTVESWNSVTIRGGLC